jgi:hypothetical protein
MDTHIDPFLEDGINFAGVLDRIVYNRDVISKFSDLTCTYKNAYIPLCFMFKFISTMCQKEISKLDKQIMILQEIDSIYKSVAGVIQKEIISQEEITLTKTTLNILIEKLNHNQEQMVHWHPIIKGTLFCMNQPKENVKKIINELH